MYVYIKETKRDEELIKNIDRPIWIKNIIIKLKKIFNIIVEKELDKSHILYIIPKVKNIDKIRKIIEKNRKAQIILSKDLKKYEKQICKESKNKTLRYYIYDILKFLLNKINRKIELENIYILANQYNDSNLEVMNYLIDKVKTVNIVTNNIKKYKQYEENVYEKEGIILTVTNNKNKSLRNAKYIINLDFLEENIVKYKINRNAIIINCASEKIEKLNCFEGIIINNIEIGLEEKEELKELYKEFEKLEMYESIENKEIKYKKYIEQIKKDKIEIKALIGNNGKISLKEIVNVQNKCENFTK